MKTNIPVGVLVRVSTHKQETNRQRAELLQTAAQRGWTVVEVLEENGVSGDADSEQRHGLQRALELAQTGRIKKLLVHEISRVARRNSIAHEFLEQLERHGVSLYWHAHQIETLLPSGKRNPAASIMFSSPSEMARAERETLRERILSGLAEARRQGTVLGRRVGSVLTPAEFLRKHRDVVRLLKGGQSIRNAAKIAGKGVSTVQRVCAAIR
jgi:DNA invertase Pin-like site-specific DNA recombinase